MNGATTRARSVPWLTLAASAAAVATIGWLARGVSVGEPPQPPIRRDPVAADAVTAAAGRVVLACPGRIEGATETVKIGAGTSGVLEAVPVEEGQQVSAGEVLARFECADLDAESQAAEAGLQVALQSRQRLLRGSREEERNEAKAQIFEAESIVRQARAAYERSVQLFSRKVASQDDLDRARRDSGVAEALLRRAREHFQLVDAPPLPEEVARADAEVELERGRLRRAQRRLDKCTIRAPISGVVLRRYMQAGESVSVAFPHVIVSLADTSHYRVRAEVDERDVGRIATHQAVVISADALSADVSGRVASIGHSMGRKGVHTGEPSEKKDRDVLEVLIDLDTTDQPLVVGLRVTVRFISNEVNDA